MTHDAHSTHDIPAQGLSPETAARRLIAALVKRDITTFFGIPGGPVCPVFEAIRLEPNARLIESRQETHAGFAAAMYHRASGKIPVLVVTCGPGITNAVSGIASAYAEHVPMLVISGDVAWASTGGRLAQDSGPRGFNAEALLRPVTVSQHRVMRPHNAVSMAVAALDAATDPMRKGPALLVIPIDVSMGTCGRTSIRTPAHRTPSDMGKFDAARIATDIATAERPLLVIGPRCRSDVAATLRCIETFGIPFITTPFSKGVVPDAHPLSLRNGGIAASMWAREYTRRGVDVCLAVGTDLTDSSIGPTPYVKSDGKLIHVDLDPSVFGNNIPTALGIRSDPGTFFSALLAPNGPEKGPLTCARVREELEEIKSTSPFDVSDAEFDAHDPVRTYRLLMDLERAVPPDTRFISDIGEHMLFCVHYLTAREAGAFSIQLELGSMGSGVTGAIGLAIGDPSRCVACITGDGGMQMAGMEALVAVRERLPILFVVMNDSRYTMVHLGMKQIFGAAEPYDTPPIDFALWARALGMPSAIVTSPGQLNAELVVALMKNGGPALIDARIDASVRVSGGGRVEALQHMSMLSAK